MSFIFPAFLWACALIAIPIIIHFFNFQRAKKVYFSNVAFLKEVKTVSRSRNRLKNWLILLMRCLAIIFLAFAFAQPFIPQDNATQVRNSQYVSLYLDNSFSMQNESGNKTLLDVGISYAQQLLKVFPESTVFQFLENSFEGNTNFFFEAKKIDEQLNRLSYSNMSRDLRNINTRQLSALRQNASGNNNLIFWISDFQKSTVPNWEKVELDSQQQYYLVPTIPNRVSNLYVDSLWLENPFIRINENNAIFLKINHFGSETASEKVIKLFLDDNQVSSSTVSLEPNTSQTIKLNFAANSAGLKRGKITIDDYPVTFDNEYFFSFKVSPPVKIIHLSAEKSLFVKNVYGNEPFFEIESYGTEAIDYNNLQKANLIVLDGLTEIDNALQGALQQFIGKGGTLAVFPATRVDLDSYQTLLGVPLKQLSEKESDKIALKTPSSENPFFAGIFEKISPNMSTPRTRPTLVWTGGQTILSLKNEQPFLSLFQKTEKSKMYLFASPLSTEVSEFAQHALFVPVMYRLAISSFNSSARLAYSFAENTAEISLDSLSKNDIFKLVPANLENKTALELIPAQRIVGNTLLMDIPKNGIVAGHYNLVKNTDNQVMSQIALNYDKSESVFDCYTPEELKNILKNRKNVEVFENIEPESFAAEFKEKNIANLLWREMLVLALLALLIEIALIRLWKS